MADSVEEKRSSEVIVKEKKEKRSAPREEKDSVPQKKQKLSKDAEFVCRANDVLPEIVSEKKKTGLKRAQANDSDDLKDRSKKFKLEASTAEKDALEEEDPSSQQESKKSYHRRMKHTLNCVLEQMEFYFSDSSLSKDRFLKCMVDQSPDGYVDLSIFANFNKLQTLRKDGISHNVLVQALSRSKFLQLNDGKTKVKRIVPFQEISQEETDKRTVYVEYLPSHATHMWVKQVFSQCGKVAYVSLPTYKTSKQIKGFAFVEFTTPEEAERACAMLNDPLPDKVMERPGKFPKTNKTLDRLQKFAPLNLAGDSNEENNPAEKQEELKTTDIDAEMKKKKKKKAKKKKPQDISAEEATTQASLDTKEQKPEGKKKKKKKKRKPSQLLEQVAEGEMPDSKQSDLCTDTQKKKALNKGETTAADVRDEEKDPDSQTKIETEEEHVGKEPVTSAGKSEETPGINSSAQSKKRNKKKKKSKGETAVASEKLEKKFDEVDEKSTEVCKEVSSAGKTNTALTAPTQEPVRKLSHKERKLLRQEDIRRKRQQKLEGGEAKHEENSNLDKNETTSQSCEEISKELEGSSQPTSILKMKRAAEKKRVEFDPVLITTEFVEAKGARKRKKPKREKPHLRVISKKDWMSLKEEYINRQKSHMKALKESLRELRQQENEAAGCPKVQQVKTMDLEEVFGTKPLKLSHEDKMAHVEKMKFTPNVIVQWWCSHEMHRDKIRTMFKESHASSIAYIDANEEARSGYIRFKDEASAEEFAKMSRNSTSFMARVLPGSALRKILKHGPTRWLSLINAVTRLLEQWDAVSAFFAAEKEAAKGKPGDRLKRISEFFEDKASMLYALFLRHALPLFTEANLLLQREEPVLHLLQPRLHDVATDVLVAFVKPSVVTAAKDIYAIDHASRKNQRDREEMCIGEAARQYMASHKGNGLGSTAITHFFEADQQEEYWEKANRDRMNKLGRKKKEQGCDRIARKMFQRNKATFFNKPSRIVFDEAEENENDADTTEKISVEENKS